MYLFLIFLCWGVSAAPNNAKYYSAKDAASYFDEFISTYGKQYVNEQEKESRFEIFKANLEDINRLNNMSQNAVFGITKFMDLTSEEFIRMYTCLIVDGNAGSSCSMRTDGDVPNSGAPGSLDYRQMGYVSRVKDQSECGSCYAFSSTGNIEGQYAKKHGAIKEFSEQQIVDCDSQSQGCQGGRQEYAFTALIDLGGSMLENEYPYENRKGQCRSNPSRVVAKLTGCQTYRLSSQEKAKQLLHGVGPMTIAIRAQALSGYQGGIVHDSVCTGPINHAVLLVGYGTENGGDYWIVKNSWGAGWGEQGYFRMQRNGGADGACGFLHDFLSTADVA